MKKIIFGLISFIVLSFVSSPAFAYCSSLDLDTYYACQQRENQHNQMMQMLQQQMQQQRQMMQQQQEYQQKLLDLQKQQMQQPVFVPQYSQGGNKYCTGSLEFDYYDYKIKAGRGQAPYMTKEEFAKACHYDY